MLFHAQALLVDIDGTLVDSTAVVVASWTAWAATHQLDVEEILRVCHGRRTQDTVAMFLPAEQVPPATRDLEELELAALDGVTALPGADVLLQELPSDRWAGVTSGSQALIRARLAAAGLPVPADALGYSRALGGRVVGANIQEITKRFYEHLFLPTQNCWMAP